MFYKNTFYKGIRVLNAKETHTHISPTHSIKIMRVLFLTSSSCICCLLLPNNCRRTDDRQVLAAKPPILKTSAYQLTNKEIELAARQIRPLYAAIH